jgi:hypothetical protein
MDRKVHCNASWTPEVSVHEKRAYSRNQIRVQVTCTTEGGATIVGSTRDLSIGGAFIETREVPAFGSKVSLRVQGGNGAEIVVAGIVRWTKEDGFGLQFQLLGAKETYVLAKMTSR